MSIALGCFGIAEITKNLDNRERRTPFNGKIHLIPTWPELPRRRHWHEHLKLIQASTALCQLQDAGRFGVERIWV